VDIVKLLLQEDPGIARIFLIDASGSTPLHNAAKTNSHNLIELLVEHVSIEIFGMFSCDERFGGVMCVRGSLRSKTCHQVNFFLLCLV